MATIVRSDKALLLAVQARFDQLPPGDRLVISECAAILKEDIRNMGLMTAREVLYQVGRLLAQEKPPGSVETMPNPTIRKER